MRLKKVYISNYKNLKDFNLSFENDSFLDIFVGKNGTGKSNLFEALIEIFRHLDEGDDASIDFDYEIAYEVENQQIEISWKKSILTVNGKDQKTIGNAPKPDNILVYYSGHNTSVSNLLEEYEDLYHGKIKTADASIDQYFIGIGPEYKELLLTTILLQHEDSICRKYICERLGIKSSAPDFKITLKRPHYAVNKSTFDIINNDIQDQFWKAAGSTKDFLDLLNRCATIQPNKGPILSQGYQANDDQYILYINCEKLRNEFKDSAPHELFHGFDKLKVLKMLEGISIELELANGISAYTSYFSDGQFQSVYIYAITEIFKERQCLTLLDEPDSFLHPEWQHQFLDQVSEISETAARTNHTLLSSHSASTISASDENQIRLFEIDGNTVKISNTPKGQVIDSLSAGLISFSESEARLNIENVLKNSTGSIVFTEGITDEVILETAWKKLYPDEACPFEIQNAFDCAFQRRLLLKNEIYTNHPDRVFFGLFDFDRAFDEWKGCKGDVIEEDIKKCLTRKLKGKPSYAILLPLPNNETIKEQIINKETGEHFKGNSHLSMELLFYGVDTVESYFEVDPTLPGNIIRFVGSKVDFANKKIPNLARKHFTVFEPIFDFIKSKLSSVTA